MRHGADQHVHFQHLDRADHDADGAGYGTIVGTPTNAIAVALLQKSLGVEISFVEWSMYGLPLVALSVPLAALIIARVQRIGESAFDPAAARAAIHLPPAWTTPEKRLTTYPGWSAWQWKA